MRGLLRHVLGAVISAIPYYVVVVPVWLVVRLEPFGRASSGKTGVPGKAESHRLFSILPEFDSRPI